MQHEWLLVHRATETEYWWFVNKRRIVRQLLDRYAAPRSVLLEAGCGGGLFSSELTAAGWRVISADVSPAAAAFAHAQGVPGALAFDVGGGWPLADNAVDAVVMLDVLEHVKNDAAGLAEVRRVLRPGGVAVIAVPAYQFLFSAWDRYNVHYRRYTAGRLGRLARDAGLEIAHMTYWNAISVPPALVLRLKDKFGRKPAVFSEFPKVPGVINAGLKAYGRIEAAWLRGRRLPFGLSVLAVLRKEEGGT